MSFELVLERDSANDQSATIVALHVACGAAVAAGDLLLEIETSKAVQEITAPRAGTVLHELEVGREVAYGTVLAHILAPGEAFEPAAPVRDAPPAAAAAVEAPPAASLADTLVTPIDQPPPLRISQAAAKLMRELGVTPERFTGGFITTAAVRALSSPDGGPASPRAAPAPRPGPQPGEDRGQPVSSLKRREIEALGSGAGQTLLSVLGVEIGLLHVPREPGHLLSARITDLVIYEAARLMRKYPRLNAAYRDGRVEMHGAICAGLAIDGGGRLVVFGIEHADRIDLLELEAVIGDAAARYAVNALTPAELTRATFTVTDLSAHPLDFVLPLLPVGQSCIIGVTRDADARFRLRCGFDHRVTEGGEVAQFLAELRERLMSFGSQRSPVEAACAYCGRTAAEAVGQFREKGLIRIFDGRGDEALCCASCWNGW